MSRTTTTSPMRCFLSSPRLVDTTLLRQVLRDLNVDVESVDDLPAAGELPALNLLSQIRSSSFILCILRKTGSGPVLLELGVALGLGKPVFLIAEDKDLLTTTLLGLPFVVSPLHAIESQRFHLDAFISNLVLSLKSPTPSTKHVKFYGGGEAVPITPTYPSALGAAAERRVAEAFSRAGGNVTVSPRFGAEAEADMIVWFPESDLGGGGPLLVEVKHRAAERFPPKGIAQIKRLIERSHLRAAILVTDTTETGVAVRMLDDAYLYGISISELERLAYAGTLLTELKKARNRLAHGVSSP